MSDPSSSEPVNAERFCEILMEEGYPIGAIKALWGARDYNLCEDDCRERARRMKDHGWVDIWNSTHEEETL